MTRTFIQIVFRVGLACKFSFQKKKQKKKKKHKKNMRNVCLFLLVVIETMCLSLSKQFSACINMLLLCDWIWLLFPLKVYALTDNSSVFFKHKMNIRPMSLGFLFCFFLDKTVSYFDIFTMPLVPHFIQYDNLTIYRTLNWAGYHQQWWVTFARLV